MKNVSFLRPDSHSCAKCASHTQKCAIPVFTTHSNCICSYFLVFSSTNSETFTLQHSLHLLVVNFHFLPFIHAFLFCACAKERKSSASSLPPSGAKKEHQLAKNSAARKRRKRHKPEIPDAEAEPDGPQSEVNEPRSESANEKRASKSNAQQQNCHHLKPASPGNSNKNIFHNVRHRLKLLLTISAQRKQRKMFYSKYGIFLSCGKRLKFVLSA